MGFIRKAIHLKPQFGHDNFTDAYVDPSHLIEEANRLCAAQLLGSFRLCGKRPDALGRTTGNGGLASLLCGGQGARGVRRVRIIGTALYSQAMSNLLISLPDLVIKEVHLSQLTLQ